MSPRHDRVRHAVLVFKLQQLLPHNVCDLLSNYLLDRAFFVVYEHRISAGVPRGSVLGPLHHAIYTADVPLPNDTTVFATFADDTKFLSTSPEYPTLVDSLQHLLNAFHEWTSH